jgi:predicted O-linked N-acetylglucosamine transferase (SPINDLY family)
MEDYFKLYNRIDIALDTFPFNGGTTTCDSLWMGVPVVTLAGTNGVSRGGVSLLTHIGLPELIAESPERYVQIAKNLAHEKERLTEIRATLRQRMQSSALMDSKAFARNLESHFRTMWKAWCQSA